MSEEHWSSPNGCHPDCPACEPDLTDNILKVRYSKGTLWGMAGDQLEYVGQRIEYREVGNSPHQRWWPHIILRFTDHVEDKYYELEFPLMDGV